MMMLLCGLGLAGDQPGWEIFGGYSLLKAETGMSEEAYYYSDLPYDLHRALRNSGMEATHRFDLSLTRNINSWLGVKAGFSRHSGTVDFSGEEIDNYYYTDYGYDETYTWSGKADYTRTTMLFGPEFSYRSDSCFRPFAHVLFGFSQSDMDPIDVRSIELDEGTGTNEGYYYRYEYDIAGKVEGQTGFAVALGGGLDIKAGKHLSIRAIQLDYMPTYGQNEYGIEYDRAYFNTPDGDPYEDYAREISVKDASGRMNNVKMSFGVVVSF